MKNGVVFRKRFLVLLILAFCGMVWSASAQPRSRIDAVRRVVDGAIEASANLKKNYVHASGVADCSTILAMKRGLSPELAGVTGLLHDIYYIRTGSYERHDVLGAQMAEQILTETGLFTADETRIVAEAIRRHDDHANVHGPYDEVLKDADVLQSYLADVTQRVNPARAERVKKLLAELGLNWNVE